jgi:hypothetical protein
VPLEDVVARKTVRLSSLPEAVKSRLQHQLMLTAPTAAAVKQSRKSKRVEPPSVFLTPDEVAAAMPTNGMAAASQPPNGVAASQPAVARRGFMLAGAGGVIFQSHPA